MTDFAQTETAAAACSAGNFCTGNSTQGDTTLFLQASEGGTGGTTDQRFSIAASGNNADAVFWEIIDGTNNLEDLDGASGLWDFRLNVVKANMNLNWTGVAACRVNSSCVNQETILTDQTGSQSLGSSGVKTDQATQASAVTIGATDLVVVVYAFDNIDAMMSQTCDLDADQNISNQWAAAAPDPAGDAESFSQGQQQPVREPDEVVAY